MPGAILIQKRIARGMAVIRILTGLLMVYHGLEVFSKETMEMYQGWDKVKALPFGSFMVYAGKAGELITGILLTLGLFTRWASLVMAAIMFFVSFFIGSGKFWYEDQHPFLFGMMALVFAIFGSGAWAIDNKIQKK
jgi:putative oxidoreductase